MRILQLKKLYLPAVSIVAVVLLLLVLIGISTYRNLNRQKKTAMDFVHRQGLALLRSLEAGARAGMAAPMWGEDAVRNLIQETGKSEDIAYLYLYDEKGTIVHHSDPSLDGKRTDLKLEFSSDDQVKSRVRKLEDGSHVYELAKRFAPFSASKSLPRHRTMMGPGHKMILHSQPNATVVLGLKMTAFEEARQADLQHAFIMAAILLALGTGALFFIFVIQNYYLVDKTLRETQDFTTQVVANMANGLLTVDPQGKVVSYNQLALELLGMEESQVKGMNLKDVIDFQKSGIEHTLTRCKSVLEREILQHRFNGESIPLALSATPIRGDDGTCRAAVIILRDLRQIKRLEEEVRRSEKLAAVGKLAAGVAHEIRNPLSSIRGFAQFLRHALAERPREQEYAEVMIKEVDRINRVVTDLLTFARPLETELAATDVKELVEHTVRLVEGDAHRRGVEVHKNISPDVSRIFLDANQMTQSLLNLLLNALQVLDDGGRIEVGVSMVGSELHIWVEDDGSGIPPEHLNKIFDPFFTTREKGTGLGLAIVHTIVENHNGEIKVESPPPGKSMGSSFTLMIPAQVAEHDTMESEQMI